MRLSSHIWALGFCSGLAYWYVLLSLLHLSEPPAALFQGSFGLALIQISLSQLKDNSSIKKCFSLSMKIFLSWGSNALTRGSQYCIWFSFVDNQQETMNINDFNNKVLLHQANCIVCFTDLGKLDLPIGVQLHAWANFLHLPQLLQKYSLLQKWSKPNRK